MGCQFSAKRRPPHQVSPPHSSTVFISPPSPSFASPPSPPFVSSSTSYRVAKSPSPSFASSSSPSGYGIVIPIDHYSDDLQMAMHPRQAQAQLKQPSRRRRKVKRIDILPDDVLLGIFDFYMNMCNAQPSGNTWHSLVHVCRRWRGLVFASPRRLNLRLYCSPKTSAGNTLDVWPALPLIIEGNMARSSGSGTTNVIVALKKNERVREVLLRALADWQLGRVLAAMQVAFPAMTKLKLCSHAETRSVIPIPDSFLRGSAPYLQSFELDGIPFPGLPKLLLSATHLVHLKLSGIPHSGYISPEAMVTLLSVLSSLETLCLEFQSPRSCPDWETRPLPPSKRFVIPTLDDFRFKGVIEYLEDLLTFIDAPRLKTLYITFFNQIDFYTPRLSQFINRAPTFTEHDAYVQFHDTTTSIGLPSQVRTFWIDVSCREPDWQLSSVAQVCNVSLPPLSTVEHLYIQHRYSQLVWKNDAIESALWLELLLPFTAVRNLYLSKEFAPGIVSALRELGGGITQVLPSLQNIFVKELELSKPSHFQEDITQIVATRQLSNHPITISVWDKSSNMESK